MIRFALMRDVNPPVRGTKDSAGIDVFVPKFDTQFIMAFNSRNTNPRSMCFYDADKKLILIHPHGQVFIPSGLFTDFSENEPSALIGFNKSGVSWDNRLAMLAAIVDQDYQGEIFITMHNYSEYPTSLREGQKLTQLIRVPVFYDEIAVVSKEDIHSVKTERADGHMGSTGK